MRDVYLGLGITWIIGGLILLFILGNYYSGFSWIALGSLTIALK